MGKWISIHSNSIYHRKIPTSCWKSVFRSSPSLRLIFSELNFCSYLSIFLSFSSKYHIAVSIILRVIWSNKIVIYEIFKHVLDISSVGVFLPNIIHDFMVSTNWCTASFDDTSKIFPIKLWFPPVNFLLPSFLHTIGIACILVALLCQVVCHFKFFFFSFFSVYLSATLSPSWRLPFAHCYCFFWVCFCILDSLVVQLYLGWFWDDLDG